MSNIVTPEWVKDAVFYQIFPDRFAKSMRFPKTGIKLEEWDTPPSVFGFKGGDLFGVTENLDYLQDIGITAIYLNPIFSSASNHRYHTYDYFQVDPLLGGNEALRELLDEAHKRNMHIILDGVFNHASRGFWQFHHVLENGAGSPYIDWFHFDPERLEGLKHWGAYPTKKQQKKLQSGEGSLVTIGYKGWWDLPALPKFNTDSLAVREFIYEVAEYWIKFGIDGWRLDVPGEINDDAFWQGFRRRVKDANPEAYITGEIWYEGHRWLQGDQFDAVMNYPVTMAALSFFTGKHLNMAEVMRAGGYQAHVHSVRAKEFADWIDAILGWYDPAITQVQLNLLDSHDTPRFLTCANGDKNSLQLALLFMFTYPGAPCIYYGDEIGLDGGHDPDCRKSFPWDEAQWHKTLLDYTRACVALRKVHPALRRGAYHRLHASDSTYVFGRELGKDKLIVALNVDEKDHAINVDVSKMGIKDGKLKAIFGKQKANVEGGTINIQIPARSGIVLKG
jgi:cyclomaltodextrinase